MQVRELEEEQVLAHELEEEEAEVRALALERGSGGGDGMRRWRRWRGWVMKFVAMRGRRGGAGLRVEGGRAGQEITGVGGMQIYQHRVEGGGEGAMQEESACLGGGLHVSIVGGRELDGYVGYRTPGWWASDVESISSSSSCSAGKRGSCWCVCDPFMSVRASHVRGQGLGFRRCSRL